MSGSIGASYGGPEKDSSTDKATDYNSEEAHELLEGSLEKRIIAYARIKHGKGEEVAAALSKGNYRESHQDPLDVLETVCGEVQETEVAESIDDVVGYQKPSMLRVAAKGTRNLAKKAHVHQWYYPFFGALPGKKQNELAEKHGDNPFHYTVSNTIAEGLALGGVMGVLIYQNGQSGDTAIALGALIGMVGALINLAGRTIVSDENKRKYEFQAAGSLLTCLPMYVTLYSIAAFKGIKNGIAESYSSALQEEQQKLLQSKPFHALLNQNQTGIEQQPEIVLTLEGERFEYDEDLIEESKRKELRRGP